MKQRIFSILTIMILSVSSVFSQKISVGLLGGVNLQNLNGKDPFGNKLEYDLITGFHAGANIQIPVAPEIYFQPGILFTTKGANNKDASPDVKISLSYIELPLNIVYKGLLGKGHVLVGFGPYLGFALAGKVKFEEGATSDIEFKNVVEAGDPALTSYMKRFDAGANIFAGYELASGIFFQLNTQLGLLKINPEDKRIINNESSVKNTGFGLSLGYRF